MLYRRSVTDDFKTPSRKYVDQFGNEYDPFHATKMMFTIKKFDLINRIMTVFLDEEIEEYATEFHKRCINVQAYALYLLKKIKDRERITYDETCGFYTVTRQFTQAYGNTRTHEILYREFIMSDNPLFFYLVADVDYLIAKVTKKKEFQKVCGSNYRKYWEHKNKDKYVITEKKFNLYLL